MVADEDYNNYWDIHHLHLGDDVADNNPCLFPVAVVEAAEAMAVSLVEDIPYWCIHAEDSCYTSHCNILLGSCLYLVLNLHWESGETPGHLVLEKVDPSHLVEWDVGQKVVDAFGSRWGL